MIWKSDAFKDYVSQLKKAYKEYNNSVTTANQFAQTYAPTVTKKAANSYIKLDRIQDASAGRWQAAADLNKDRSSFGGRTFYADVARNILRYEQYKKQPQVETPKPQAQRLGNISPTWGQDIIEGTDRIMRADIDRWTAMADAYQKSKEDEVKPHKPKDVESLFYKSPWLNQPLPSNIKVDSTVKPGQFVYMKSGGGDSYTLTGNPNDAQMYWYRGIPVPVAKDVDGNLSLPEGQLEIEPGLFIDYNDINISELKPMIYTPELPWIFAGDRKPDVEASVTEAGKTVDPFLGADMYGLQWLRDPQAPPSLSPMIPEGQPLYYDIVLEQITDVPTQFPLFWNKSSSSLSDKSYTIVETDFPMLLTQDVYDQLKEVDKVTWDMYRSELGLLDSGNPYDVYSLDEPTSITAQEIADSKKFDLVVTYKDNNRATVHFNVGDAEVLEFDDVETVSLPESTAPGMLLGLDQTVFGQSGFGKFLVSVFGTGMNLFIESGDAAMQLAQSSNNKVEKPNTFGGYFWSIGGTVFQTVGYSLSLIPRLVGISIGGIGTALKNKQMEMIGKTSQEKMIAGWERVKNNFVSGYTNLVLLSSITFDQFGYRQTEFARDLENQIEEMKSTKEGFFASEFLIPVYEKVIRRIGDKNYMLEGIEQKKVHEQLFMQSGRLDFAHDIRSSNLEDLLIRGGLDWGMIYEYINTPLETVTLQPGTEYLMGDALEITKPELDSFRMFLQSNALSVDLRNFFTANGVDIRAQDPYAYTSGATKMQGDAILPGSNALFLRDVAALEMQTGKSLTLAEMYDYLITEWMPQHFEQVRSGELTYESYRQLLLERSAAQRNYAYEAARISVLHGKAGNTVESAQMYSMARSLLRNVIDYDIRTSPLNPYAGYTFSADPLRKRDFYDEIIDAELQLRSPLTRRQALELSYRHVDISTEILGQMILDFTNLGIFGTAMAAAKGATKTVFKAGARMFIGGLEATAKGEKALNILRSSVRAINDSAVIKLFTNLSVSSMANKNGQAVVNVFEDILKVQPKNKSAFVDTVRKVSKFYTDLHKITDPEKLLQFKNTKFPVSGISARSIDLLDEFSKIVPEKEWVNIADGAWETVISDVADNVAKSVKREYKNLGEEFFTSIEYTNKIQAGIDRYVLGVTGRRSIAYAIGDDFKRAFLENYSVKVGDGTILTGTPLGDISNFLLKRNPEGVGVKNFVQNVLIPTQKISTQITRGWIMATLARRPSWMIYNFIDNTFRYMMAGGSPLLNLVEILEFAISPKQTRELWIQNVIPPEVTAQPLSAMAGTSSSVTAVAATSAKMSVQFATKAANPLMLPAYYKAIFKINSEGKGFFGKMWAGLLAYPQAVRALSTSIESSMKARLYVKLYNRNMLNLNRRVLDDMLFEAQKLAREAGLDDVATKELTDYLDQAWWSAGEDAAKLRDLISMDRKGIHGSNAYVPKRLLETEWFDADTKTMFLLSVTKRLDNLKESLAKQGIDKLSPDHFRQFFTDMKLALNAETQIRASRLYEMYQIIRSVNFSDGARGAVPQYWTAGAEFNDITVDAKQFLEKYPDPTKLGSKEKKKLKSLLKDKHNRIKFDDTDEGLIEGYNKLVSKRDAFLATRPEPVISNEAIKNSEQLIDQLDEIFVRATSDDQLDDQLENFVTSVMDAERAKDNSAYREYATAMSEVNDFFESDTWTSQTGIYSYLNRAGKDRVRGYVDEYLMNVKTFGGQMNTFFINYYPGPRLMEGGTKLARQTKQVAWDSFFAIRKNSTMKRTELVQEVLSRLERGAINSQPRIRKSELLGRMGIRATFDDSGVLSGIEMLNPFTREIEYINSPTMLSGFKQYSGVIDINTYRSHVDYAGTSRKIAEQSAAESVFIPQPMKTLDELMNEDVKLRLAVKKKENRDAAVRLAEHFEFSLAIEGPSGRPVNRDMTLIRMVEQHLETRTGKNVVGTYKNLGEIKPNLVYDALLEWRDRTLGHRLTHNKEMLQRDVVDAIINIFSTTKTEAEAIYELFSSMAVTIAKNMEDLTSRTWTTSDVWINLIHGFYGGGRSGAGQIVQSFDGAFSFQSSLRYYISNKMPSNMKADELLDNLLTKQKFSEYDLRFNKLYDKLKEAGTKRVTRDEMLEHLHLNERWITVRKNAAGQAWSLKIMDDSKQGIVKGKFSYSSIESEGKVKIGIDVALNKGTKLDDASRGRLLRWAADNDVDYVKIGDEFVGIKPEWAYLPSSARPRAQGIYGSTFFLEQEMNTYKAVVKGFQNANTTTAIEEIFHALYPALPKYEQDILEEWGEKILRNRIETGNASKDLLSKVGTPEWHAQVQEVIVTGFQKFVIQNKAPNSTIQQIFDKLRNTLLGLYKSFKNYFDGIILSDEVDKSFKRILDGEYIAKQGAKIELPKYGVVMQQVNDTLDEYDIAFREWFANSKAVDSRGMPLVLYHGTRHDFDIFRPGDGGIHLGSVDQANKILQRYRSYDMTDIPRMGEQILPVFIRAENPLRVPDLIDWTPRSIGRYIMENLDEGLGKELMERGDYIFGSDPFEIKEKQSEIIRDILQRLGNHDSIVYENIFEGTGDSWLVFDPTQVKSIWNKGKFSREDPRILFQEIKATVTSDQLYFKSQRIVDQLMPQTATVDKVRSLLKANIKRDEYKWLDIESFLEGKERVSKQEVLDYIRMNDIRIEEITKTTSDKNAIGWMESDLHRRVRSWTEYINDLDLVDDSGEAIILDFDTVMDYVHMGRMDYALGYPLNDDLLHEFEEIIDMQRELSNALYEPDVKYENYVIPGGQNYREVLFTMPSLDPKFSYKAHWDENNVLMHARMQNFQDSNGRNILVIEEMQSDLHQQGRRLGYFNIEEQRKAQENFRLTEKKLNDWEKNNEAIKQAKWEMAEAGKFLGKLNSMFIDDMISGKEFEELSNQIIVRRNQFRAVIAKEKESTEYIKLREAYEQAASAMYKQGSRVPDAPFKETSDWVGLGMKRIIQMAADEGYDGVAWTGANVQSRRWSGMGYVNNIKWKADPGSANRVVVLDGYINGSEVGRRQVNLDYSDSKKIIGETVSKQISDAINNGEFEGTITFDKPFLVGERWAEKQYDTVMPNVSEKLIKQYNGKVESILFSSEVDDFSLSAYYKLEQDFSNEYGRPTTTAIVYSDPFTRTVKETKTFVESPSVLDPYNAASEWARKTATEVAQVRNFSMQGFYLSDELKFAAKTKGFPLFQKVDDIASKRAPTDLELDTWVDELGKYIDNVDNLYFDQRTGFNSFNQLVDNPAEFLKNNPISLSVIPSSYGYVVDTLGQDAGNVYLEGFAGIIRKVLPDTSNVFSSGDHFTILTRDIQSAYDIVGKIDAFNSGIMVNDFHGNPYVIDPHISFGINHRGDVRASMESALESVKDVELNRAISWSYHNAVTGYETTEELFDLIRQKAPEALASNVKKLSKFSTEVKINSPEFKKWWTWDWIKNQAGTTPSTLVDKDGMPLVLYHGTSEDFFVFNTVTEFGAADYGAHFGTADQANSIMSFRPKGNARSVYPVYISMQNPLVLNSDPTNFYPGDVSYALRYSGDQKLVRIGLEMEDAIDKARTDGTSIIDFQNITRDILQKHGYDGIKYPNAFEGANRGEWSYLVWNPEQIKSVFNGGRFDPNTPHILYQSLDDFDVTPEIDEAWSAFVRAPIFEYGSDKVSLEQLFGSVMGQEDLIFKGGAEGFANWALRVADSIADEYPEQAVLFKSMSELADNFSNYMEHSVIRLDSLVPTPLPLWKTDKDLRSYVSSAYGLASEWKHELDALDMWADLLTEQSKTGLIGKTEIPKEIQDILKTLGKKTANEKAEAIDVARYGGEYKGIKINPKDGAIPRTNFIMMNYSDMKVADSYIKNVFPFWTYPRQSVPYWISLLTNNPELLVWYQRYQRWSKMAIIQNGAVTSTGESLPSLEGYIPLMDGLWWNPLAPTFYRYAFPRVTDVPETEDVANMTALQHAAKFLLDDAPLYGLSPSPIASALLKAFYSPYYPKTSIMYEGAKIIFPLEYVPPIFERWILAQIRRTGIKNAPETWSPRVSWQDYLVEREILSNAYLQIQEESNRYEQEQIAKEAYKLITSVDRELNPDWIEARNSAEMSTYWRSLAGMFTGVYSKEYEKGVAELNLLRNYNNMLKESINNHILYKLFNLDPDESVRYDYYIDKKFNTPEYYIYNALQMIRYVENPDTGLSPADSQERRELIALEAEIAHATDMYYEAIGLARETLNQKLLDIPIGNTELRSELYEQYFAELDKINNNPVFEHARRESYLGYKPDTEVYETFYQDWWRQINSTRPTRKDEEDWDEYQARILEWEQELPKMADKLFGVMLGSATLRITTEGTREEERLAQLNGWITELKRQTNVEGWKEYKKSNDYPIDAIWAAYEDLYMNEFMETVFSAEGTYDRELALREFYRKHPSEPTEREILDWIHKEYGIDRFEDNEIISIIHGARFATGEEVLNAGNTEMENYQSHMWDMKGWLGPMSGDLYKSFVRNYVKAGGKEWHLEAWPELGDPSNDEEWYERFQLMEEVIEDMGITAPSDEQLVEYKTATEQNSVFRSYILGLFGEDFYDNMNSYYAEDDAGRREYREAYPEKYEEIKSYYDEKDSFAREFPIWAKYYHSGFDTESGTSGGSSGGYVNTGSSGSGSYSGSTSGGYTQNRNAVSPSYRSPTADMYLPIGRRSAFEGIELLTPGRLGRGGTVRRPWWPKELLEKIHPNVVQQVVLNYVAGTNKITKSAADYLAAAAKYDKSIAPVIRAATVDTEVIDSPYSDLWDEHEKRMAAQWIKEHPEIQTYLEK